MMPFWLQFDVTLILQAVPFAAAIMVFLGREPG
jgi:hypothetical protein